MDIYGSFLAETDSSIGSIPAGLPFSDHGGEVEEKSLSMFPTLDRTINCPHEEERRAVHDNVQEDILDTPLERPFTAHVAASSGSSKPNFSVLSKYKWGTYGAGEALLPDRPAANDDEEEVECLLEGEDDIVLLSDTSDLQMAPVRERPVGWGLGGSIYKIVDNSAKKAGDIIYYAANSVGETGNKLMMEAKATLSHTSDMAIVSVAGSAASETFMFAVDRSRLLGHQLVNSLQGDPELSRRLHLRRLLASGSWAEFSAKCQLATLPWYARQLIHLTRYDNLGSIEKHIVNRSNSILEATAKKGGAQKRKKEAQSLQSSTETPSQSVSNSSIRASDGYLDEPTQLDTLILNEDEVKYLNEVSRRTAPDAKERKNEASSLSDSEFHKWILSRAKEGSADAEYALTKWFTPPSFTESFSCRTCNRVFGISLFRHHCRHCGHSFCGEHSSETRCILKYGFISPVRVCDTCACIIDRENRMDRQRWKKERIDDYDNNCLIPYFEVAEDRGVDKAYRLGLGTLHIVRNMGIALTYPALVAAESLEILRKYGLVGLAGILLRNDFMEAVEALKQITSMDERYPLSIRQLTACIYYKLAIERGLRGCDPDGELRAHVACPDSRWKQIAGSQKSTSTSSAYIHAQEEADRESARHCKLVDDFILNEFIRYASIALLVAYEENSVECQRLAELQGFQTLISDPTSEPEIPSYGLFVCSGNLEPDTNSGLPRPHRKREAVLAIRGTHTIQDVVTDLRAIPIVFPPSKKEIDGIMNGTVWVHCKNKSSSYEDKDDTKISASAGETDEKSPTTNLKVYAEEVYITEEVGWHAPVADIEYACRGPARAALNILAEVGPALIRLAEDGHEVRIVGHSLGGAVASLLALLLRDYIPSIKALAYSPPCFLSSGLAEKMESFVHSCVLHDDIISRVSPESIRLLMKELIVFRDKVFKFVEQDWYDAIKRAGSIWTPRWRDSRSYVPTHKQTKDPMQKSKYTSRGRPNDSKRDEISVGIGTVVVGEDDRVLVRREKPTTNIGGNSQRVKLNALAFISDITGEISGFPSEHREQNIYSGHKDSIEEEEDDIFFNEEGGADRAVIIGDTVVAKLNVPGRVFHIFPHRGVYRISEVPRSFPSLNRIEIQGDIFSDHRSTSVYDALLEVRSVRASKCPPPPWTPYDASAVCQRCKSSFTWHTTFQGDAQELRERYNCVCCGALVCGPCSTHMFPIPRLGLNTPTRVCDACFHLGHHTAPTNPIV